MTTIVKVQVPLSGPGPCLIYDKANEHVVQQPLPLYVKNALARDVKGYFEAAWDKANACWNIGKRVEAQPW